MAYALARDPGPRYQWEPWDSKFPNGSLNCNAASTAYILDYYKDAQHDINYVRRHAGAIDGKTMTTMQVSTALITRGITNYRAQISLATLKSLLATGRRPVLVGLWDERVPLSIRGHSFTGMHGIVALCNAYQNGVSGVLVMDPNFSPWTGRDDPTHGERFYPDSVMAAAMYDYNLRATSWSVIPVNPKTVIVQPTPVPPVSGFPRTIYFAGGKTYVGRQFDNNGKIIGTKPYYLSKSSNAPAKMRSLIKNQQGYWYYVTAGIWAGYWIQETTGIT